MRKLIALVFAVLTLMVGTSCTKTDQPEPKPKLTQGYGYSYILTEDTTGVVEILKSDGSVIFKDDSLKPGSFFEDSQESRSAWMQLPTTVLLPDGSAQTFERNFAKVELDDDTIVAFAKLYNSLDEREALVSTSWSILGSMAKQAMARFELPVTTLAAEEDPIIRSNSTVADGYGRGLAAWQVAQGTAGYNYEYEYSYDFACIEYAVRIDEAATQAPREELQRLLSEMGVEATVSIPQDTTFLVNVNSETPCDITSSGQSPPSLPKTAGPPESIPTPVPTKK